MLKEWRTSKNFGRKKSQQDAKSNEVAGLDLSRDFEELFGVGDVSGDDLVLGAARLLGLGLSGGSVGSESLTTKSPRH